MKKICVVTGSRADYGLLRRLMQKLSASDCCELQIVLTGMNLDNRFGDLIREVENDGLSINWRVNISLDSDTPQAVSKDIGTAISGLADAYASLKPDLVVLLGDRYEIFAAAVSATVASVPIAHLHGGEITRGSIDDTLRHAITKMSQLHFVANESYRQRVIQLGESPNRVWTVGAFGVDAAFYAQLLDRPQLEANLGISLDGPSLLVTFHPETGIAGEPHHQITEILAALRLVDAKIVFTMPNSDVGNSSIVSAIKEFVRSNPETSVWFPSLGQTNYFSLMSRVTAVVGNSSSALIEAPLFGVGVVNIGARQDGRLRPSCVVDCEATRDAVYSAVNRLLTTGSMLGRKAEFDSPYGAPGAAQKAVRIIEQWKPELANKDFYDLPASLIGDSIDDIGS